MEKTQKTNKREMTAYKNYMQVVKTFQNYSRKKKSNSKNLSPDRSNPSHIFHMNRKRDAAERTDKMDHFEQIKNTDKDRQKSNFEKIGVIRPNIDRYYEQMNSNDRVLSNTKEKSSNFENKYQDNHSDQKSKAPSHTENMQESEQASVCYPSGNKICVRQKSSSYQDLDGIENQYESQDEYKNYSYRDDMHSHTHTNSTIKSVI